MLTPFLGIPLSFHKSQPLLQQENGYEEMALLEHGAWAMAEWRCREQVEFLFEKNWWKWENPLTTNWWAPHIGCVVTGFDTGFVLISQDCIDDVKVLMKTDKWWAVVTPQVA